MPTIKRFGSVNAAVKSGINPHHYREVYPKELLTKAGSALPLIRCGNKAFTKYSAEECAKIDRIRELQFNLRQYERMHGHLDGEQAHEWKRELDQLQGVEEDAAT